MKKKNKQILCKNSNDFKNTMKVPPTVYVLLDKQSSGAIRNIIEMHIPELNYVLFKRFGFGTTNFNDFVAKLYKIRHLRNYAIHGNSLRIAMYIKNIKTNEMRTSKQAREYENLVHNIIEFDVWQDF